MQRSSLWEAVETVGWLNTLPSVFYTTWGEAALETALAYTDSGGHS